MEKIHAHVACTDTEHSLLHLQAQLVQDEAQKVARGVIVSAFGSYGMGLSKYNADLDLAINFEHRV